MVSRNFLVEHCDLYTNNLNVTWNGEEKMTLGYLSCSGEGYNLIAHFLDMGERIPVGSYDPDTKIGTIFVPYDQIDNYTALIHMEEPVYAYLNANQPELNCLTVNEPVREYAY